MMATAPPITIEVNIPEVIKLLEMAISERDNLQQLLDESARELASHIEANTKLLKERDEARQVSLVLAQPFQHKAEWWIACERALGWKR